jgi:hypothetical protein
VDDNGESASERTGAFALRSGLRGLGLEVEDPVLDDDTEVPTRATGRPAPPARPRLLDPTPDLDDDDREPLPPVQPRADVQQRFASASTSAPAALDARDDEDDDDEDGPRRRPWWRPGG